MKIYLATGNTHKRDELGLLFPEHQLVLPKEEGIPFDFDETGKTYFENSYGKAQALYEVTRSPVLADDSGLSVEALDGAPGIYSARYGFNNGTPLTSTQQMDRLLETLGENSHRQAAFVCCLTLVLNPYRFYSIQETLKGSIAWEKSGSHGFGYDPIFIPEGSSRTLAHFSPEEKALISHRGRAAAALRPLISQIQI